MFLKIIFFAFAVLAILWEFYNVHDGKRISAALKATKGLPADQISKTMNTYRSLNALYWIWALVGLFSSQWFLFLVFIAWSMFQRLLRTPREVDGFISMCILIFIVINAFHLHIRFY